MTQVATSYLRQYELKTIFSECGFKHLVCQVEDVEGEVSGLHYRGTVSKTITGIECQRWDVKTPHNTNVTKNIGG